MRPLTWLTRLLGTDRPPAGPPASPNMVEALRSQREGVVTSVSHEIRTPLTVLRGVAETLGTHGLVDDRARPLLAAQERALAEVEELLLPVLEATQAMRDRDRRPVLHEPVDLVELCVGVLGSEVQDEPGAASGPMVISSDPDLLRRALDAVVSQQARVIRPDRHLVLRIELLGSRALVEVSGAGACRAGADVERLPASTGGMGLHLLTAEALVHQVGGQVEVAHHSTVDQRVRLVLPDGGRRPGPRRTTRGPVVLHVGGGPISRTA